MIDKHTVFYELVTLGIACGLETPQEWIRNFEYKLTEILPYDKIPEVEKIIWEQIVPSLYSCVNLREECDVENLKKWVFLDK